MKLTLNKLIARRVYFLELLKYTKVMASKNQTSFYIRSINPVLIASVKDNITATSTTSLRLDRLLNYATVTAGWSSETDVLFHHTKKCNKDLCECSTMLGEKYHQEISMCVPWRRAPAEDRSCDTNRAEAVALCNGSKDCTHAISPGNLMTTKQPHLEKKSGA